MRRASAPTTVAVLEEFISNEDDGWNYVVDALTHSLEEALAHRQDAELRLAPPRSLFALDRNELEPGHLLVGRAPRVGVAARSTDRRAPPGPDLGSP